MAPLEGALVAGGWEAVSEAVVERLVVREVAELVEATELVLVRDCELNVVLRDTGTPVPIEAPVAIEVIVEFLDAGTRVDVPE